jgi:hypothetical protein
MPRMPAYELIKHIPAADLSMVARLMKFKLPVSPADQDIEEQSLARRPTILW